MTIRASSSGPATTRAEAERLRAQCAICQLQKKLQHSSQAEIMAITRQLGDIEAMAGLLENPGQVPEDGIRYSGAIPPAGAWPGVVHAFTGEIVVACVQWRADAARLYVTIVSVAPALQRRGIAAELGQARIQGRRKAAGSAGGC